MKKNQSDYYPKQEKNRTEEIGGIQSTKGKYKEDKVHKTAYYDAKDEYHYNSKNYC